MVSQAGSNRRESLSCSKKGHFAVSWATHSSFLPGLAMAGASTCGGVQAMDLQLAGVGGRIWSLWQQRCWCDLCPPGSHTLSFFFWLVPLLLKMWSHGDFSSGRVALSSSFATPCLLLLTLGSSLQPMGILIFTNATVYSNMVNQIGKGKRAKKITTFLLLHSLVLSSISPCSLTNTYSNTSDQAERHGTRCVAGKPLKTVFGNEKKVQWEHGLRGPVYCYAFLQWLVWFGLALSWAFWRGSHAENVIQSLAGHPSWETNMWLASFPSRDGPTVSFWLGRD